MENERERIIELVKQGILSTDEALTLLENISKKEGKTVATEKIRETEQEPELEEETAEEESYDFSQGWNNGRNPHRPRNNRRSHERKKETKADDAKNAKETAEENDRFQSVIGDLSQAGEKLGSFLNSAFKQVKDMPFPFLTSTKLEREFVYHDTTLSILEFDIANGNVEFKPSDNEDVRIQATIKLFKEYPEDEALQIFFDKTTLRVDEETLRFESKSKQIVTNLTVYLPKRLYDYASIKLLNGNVHMDELQGRDLFVKTTNGNVSIGTISATLVELETVNGNVRIQNGEVRDISLKTFNGGVAAKGEFYAGVLKTKNGNIQYYLTEPTATSIEAKTGTGDVEISLPKEIGIDGEIHTNFGKLRVDFKDVEVLDSKSETVHKKMTFTKIPNGEANIAIRAETTAGSVKIKEAK